MAQRHILERQEISGTLIETSLSARHIKDCVFGVGLNVNQASFSDALPNPVSLNQIVGHEVDRGELLEKSYRRSSNTTR